jgi:hypothetical protein
VLSLFPYLRVIGPMAFGTNRDAPATLGSASATVAAVAALSLLGAAPFWGAY